MTKLVGKEFSSESTTESVSIDEAKEHLYIDASNTDFDTILTNIIVRVRQWIEEITAVSLIERTVVIYIDYDSPCTLPFGPVTSFTSAAYKIGINEYQAMTLDDEFEIEAGKFISYIGNTRYKLEFEAGYTSSTIPEGLRMAFLNEIARRFDKRGDGNIPESNDLLDPYKNLEWLI